MLSFPRFDLSESSYAFLLLARKTPAWREVYTQILDELLRRHTTFWAAVDWLTQIGPDPGSRALSEGLQAAHPEGPLGPATTLPGWTANGVEPWGLQPDPIGATGNLFFRGFFNLMLAIHRAVSGEATWDRPFEMTGLEDRTFSWTHRGDRRLPEPASGPQTPHGPHCENTKSWPFCLSAAGLGLQLTDATLGTRDPLGLRRAGSRRCSRRSTWASTAAGNLKWVALYYDPLLDRVHGEQPRPRPLPVALRRAAEPRARRAALPERRGRRSAGTSASCRCFYPGVDPRPLTIAYLLAREYGDHTTERRLAQEAREASRTRASSTRRAAATRTSSATSSGTASPIRAARRARSTC